MPTAAEKKKDKRRPATASTAPTNPELARFIEEQFRGEVPNWIDAYPLEKGKHREERLFHYDVKPNEDVGGQRAVELANEIQSKCQLHSDTLFWAGSLPKRLKVFQVVVVDNNRGGPADPVGTYPLAIEARSGARPAPDGDDEEGEDGPMTPRSMMERVFTDTMDRDQRGIEHISKQVGEVMLLLKDSWRDRDQAVAKMGASYLAVLEKFADALSRNADRAVEAQAVAIDAADHAENRRDQASRRDRENMWNDVMKAGMLEAVAVVGKVMPGIGGLFTAMLSGKPLPDPPQLTAGPTPPAAAPGAVPALPAVPEEQVLIGRFIAAARAHKIDADHTAAEKLFGKDDDKTHAVLEEGVFRREQVNVLAAVAEGKMGVESLFDLLPDSGKPEAINPIQLFKAMPFLTPPMREDLDKMVTLLRSRRAAAPAK